MTLKNDAKLEEEPTLGSKNGMSNFVNFNASSSKSENLHSDVLLQNSTDELFVITQKNDMQNLQRN